jgi:multidrug efflux pump subunit AcrA (membrane-fusion protein)
MFARLSLTLAERSGALLIPKEALVYELAGRFVYRIKDGKAERVAVELGTEMDDRVEVRSGLSAGDEVVTDGRFRIRNGSPVRVVEGAAQGKG